MKKTIGFLFLISAFSIPNLIPAELSVCSFNIQFLGQSDSRDHAGLAALLKTYDIVVVQELVAPPFAGTFPDGKKFNPDPQSTIFFDLMEAHGFSYLISSEDTGPGNTNQNNGSATEWWVAFYKHDKVIPAIDLPSGFLASDRTKNVDFERVPYAFAFRSPDSTLDFVLVSVHLRPGSGSKDKQRRKQEISAIADWIDSHSQQERNVIILGDMNIENASELGSFLPTDFNSLNDECVPTNTNKNSPKPYDQIIYSVANMGSEVDQAFGFRVVDLVETMAQRWARFSNKAFPGNPYKHDEFRKYYSDHNPVVFRLKSRPTGDGD
jgi:exonuclease III